MTQSVSDEEIHFALTFTNPHAQQQTSDNILALNTLETSSSLGEVIEAAETVLGDTFFAIFSLLLGVVLGVSIKVLWNRTESKSKLITVVLTVGLFVLSFLYGLTLVSINFK